ncbi:MAG TPA: hypothetical protein VMB21_11700 [Candidatus Limnocylindria bacterium]|nr:hypothetical protein [Candidatus Limnocylindria bacterium]
MIIKFLVLAVLIRLLIATDKPFLCSGLYAGVSLIFGLVRGGPVGGVMISAGIGFVLASVYFWLLSRLDTGSLVWWLVALLGIAIGLV